jgi:hypothetical protein
MTGTTPRRRGVAAATALAASVGLLAATAPSASASSSRCPAGKVCVFQYGGFKGEMRILTAGTGNLGTFNDKTSSIVNNSRMWVSFFKDRDYRGDYSMYMPGPVENDLTSGSISRAWDNTISSVRIATTQHEAVTGVGHLDWTALSTRPANLPAHGRFGDLDGDGRPDLLQRAADGRLWFMPGTLDSAGRAVGRLVGGGWNTMTQLVRHGDYNGDRREDVFARDTAGTLWFYPGSGKGSFTTRVRIGGGWNTMREVSAAGDLNSDGRADLLARDTAGTLWLYPGNGRGGHGTRARIGGGWNSMNQLAAPGDMTGDGRPDLLARDTARALWLYPGSGKGTFGLRKKLSYAWPADEPIVSAGDLSGDGHADLMRPINHQMYVYRGDGRGGLGDFPWGDMSWDRTTGVRIF